MAVNLINFGLIHISVTFALSCTCLTEMFLLYSLFHFLQGRVKNLVKNPPPLE